MARLAIKRRRRAERRVLKALAVIPDAALRRWIDRHYATVISLARAELALRALKARGASRG